MLSEINIAPRILTNFTGVMPPQFKKDLDSYLKTRSPVTFLSDLRSNLQVNWFDLSFSLLCLQYRSLCVHCPLCVIFGVSIFSLICIFRNTVEFECGNTYLFLWCAEETEEDRSRVCRQPELRRHHLISQNMPTLYTYLNTVVPVHWVTLTGLYTLLIFLSLTQL